jgi:threonine dehydrogenase-like Zn-dependent dehydrogenase
MSRVAIYRSDLYIYRSINIGEPTLFGLSYKGVSYISKIGSSVSSLKVSNPVIIPFTIDEGHLYSNLTSYIYTSYGNRGDLGGI